MGCSRPRRLRLVTKSFSRLARLVMMNRYHMVAGSRHSVSTRNERKVSTRYSGTTMGAPMLTRMSGVTTKITTAAAVLDRSEAYQGLALGLAVAPTVGDLGLVGVRGSVIVYLIRFETDDGVARPADRRSAGEHLPVVPFGTVVAECYTCV